MDKHTLGNNATNFENPDRSSKHNADLLELTPIQEKYMLEGCPEYGGTMHEIPNNNDTELYLWCDDCDVSMDSDGGYTN